MTTTIAIISSIILISLIVILLVIFLRQKEVVDPQQKTVFTTKHQVIIKLSKKTEHIQPATFEGWLDELVQFWNEKQQWKQADILEKMRNITIVTYDSCYLTIPWDNESGELKVSGVTYPVSQRIEIAALPTGNTATIEDRVKSLIRHEVSHMIIGGLGGYWSNEASHTLFADVNLGA